MENIFDLSDENNFFSSEFSDDFKKIYKSSFKDYAKFIDACSSNNNSKNIYWWISSPASRRELQSSLYKNYCILKLVFFLYKNQKLPSKIIVPNSALKYIICNSLKLPSIDIGISKKKISFTDRFRNLLRPFNFLMNKAIQTFYIKIKYSRLNDSKNTILLESFITSELMEDRYYPELSSYLSKDSKKIVFIPTIANFKIKNIFSLFKNISLDKEEYFFRESILSFSELYRAAFYFKKVRNISLKILNTDFYNIDCDLSPLINHSLLNEAFSSISAEGLLNYFFFRGLKKHNYELDTLIDWWENTSMDKGTNFAINKFFKKGIARGYMGFIPNNYAFELSPTYGEIDGGVIPEVIGVMGNNFLNLPKRICNEQNSILAPALRFNNLEQSSNSILNTTKDKILVVLPAYFDQAKNIIKLIVDAGPALKDENLLIKSHPSLNMDNYLLKITYPKVEIDNSSSVPSLLKSSYVLLTGGSSAAIEAIIQTTPVINVFPKTFPLSKLIPENTPKELYSTCSSSEKLEVLLSKYKEKQKFISSVKINYEDYFHKPNAKNVAFFFNF
tara:strand:+ start:8872 stop:10551 length:1680 start_codon:yes stop_codon:yes gene_type:complete